MTTRTVTIPPFQDALGNGQGAYVRFALVDLYGHPLVGYTADSAIVTGERVAADPLAPVDVALVPNAEISPASRWRVTVEHGDIPTPPTDCTLLAGAGAISLAALLQIGAPADPLDFWGAYLLTADERAAMDAALNAPSAGNPIATIADVTGGGLPSAEADESMAAGQPMRLVATGHAALVDAATAGHAEVAGIVVAAVVPGFAATYSRSRVTLADWNAATGGASLNPGAVYYLNPAAPGTLTTTAPEAPGTYSTRVGRAAAADTLQIELEPPIRL